jgi:hypothetical protein
MNGVADTAPPALDPYGCWQGRGVQTPMEVANRPGLSAIAYRIGTHPQFNQSMLARLSAISDLRTQADDDFSIALLDAWAAVADVLTFYQERIANESYLGTATERLSLLELSRLIGYEPRPAVAASTYLAFTLESAPGGPDQAARPTTIDIGTKVQSIPRPGDQPQTFETIEKIRAQVEWSAMRPRLTQPQVLAVDMPHVTLHGIANNLKPGDSVLIIAGNGAADRAVRRVTRVAINTAASTTQLDLVTDPPGPPPFVPKAAPSGAFLPTREALSGELVGTRILGATWGQSDLLALANAQNWSLTAIQSNIIDQTATAPGLPVEMGIFAFRQRAGLFGYNAPRWDSLPESQRTGTYVPQYDADGHLVVDVPKGADGKPLPNAAPIPVYTNSRPIVRPNRSLL